VLVAATAAIIGDNIGYLIGRSIGIRWSRSTADTSDSMSRDSKWASICFCDMAARLSSSEVRALLRTCAALLAGVNRMSCLHF